MIALITIIISILLDGILTNYLPFMENNLSIFTPLLTVVSLFVIYPLYDKKEKKYEKTAFIIGLVYDLLYTNLLFLHAIIFLILSLLIKKIYKTFPIDMVRVIIFISILIISYELLMGLIIWIFQLTPITIQKLIYKISHSLVLNIIYGEILFIIIKYIPKKYKKIRLN